MSDEKIINENEDLLLADREASRTGEGNDNLKKNPETGQAIILLAIKRRGKYA